MAIERIGPEQLHRMMERGEDPVVIDARSRHAYDESTYKIAGSIRIPPDEIERRWREVPRGRPVVAY